MLTNITEEQKLALIAALQEEANALPDADNKEEYPVVIEYLNTGEVPGEIPEGWDILERAVNDIESLLIEYAI